MSLFLVLVVSGEPFACSVDLIFMSVGVLQYVVVTAVFHCFVSVVICQVVVIK
jgi:hypothetical protein